MSAIITRTPASANAAAIPRPMPLAAPVTTATRPSSRIIVTSGCRLDGDSGEDCAADGRCSLDHLERIAHQLGEPYAVVHSADKSRTVAQIDGMSAEQSKPVPVMGPGQRVDDLRFVAGVGGLQSPHQQPDRGV